MKTERSANLPASIRARLQAFASAHKLDFQLVLIRYASERLLYRLTSSPYGERFILKGAMLFLLWDAASSRTTRDIDLMGFGDSGLNHLQRVFRDICSQSVMDDGLRFIPESVRAETIHEEQEYGGVRIRLYSLLERARIPLQVDIGFGNPPFPKARLVVWPGLLDFPKTQVKVYPPEASIAEKLEAMVRFGIANSRMKDFYDIWWMASHFSFRSVVLVKSITATFRDRQMIIPQPVPLALQEEFYRDSINNAQWNAFLHRVQLNDIPPSFTELGRFLSGFLIPVFTAVPSDDSLKSKWKPGGPWQPE
jgi:predicted nucleotidyltransferase component of viral defense system